MGHRITQFTGHMIDMETDQQGHSHPHPEPSLFYGSLPNFPHPNFHLMVPAPGNQSNFNFHPIPERHNNALFYGIPQHQPPASNLDFAIGAPSAHYNPYLPAPSGIRDFPVQVNHGTHDQLTLSSTPRVVGIPTEAYSRSIPYMESIRATFKRKNADGASGSYPYHNVSAGPSSSIAPVSAMPTDSEISTMLDAPSFLPSEYGGSDPMMVESGSQRSARNRPRMIPHEPILAHNTGHLMQGNFPAQPVQLPGNPWMDMQYGANHGDAGSFAWTRAPLPYPHVPDMSTGLNGAGNRSPSGFLHPPLPQGHPGAHSLPPPMQGVRGFSVNHPSQVAAPSHQIPTISPPNPGINHFQDIVEAGSSFLAPAPPVSFRSYRPPRREMLLDSYARHPNFPQMRVLPEDEVAILGFPGYHDAAVNIDQHRDMRLDIDHMSYEELLALGEQIGSVGTGLSEEFIHKNLKIRTFASSAACINSEDATSPKQQMNFCVICQMDYENGEEIGTVDCGHEYHRGCLKKWLMSKNSCPVCKSTALGLKAKDS